MCDNKKWNFQFSCDLNGILYPNGILAVARYLSGHYCGNELDDSANHESPQMTGQKNFDVIVCGSLHLDIVVDAPHLPRLDETVPGSHWKKICGGKGGNQAVMAARAGALCAMIGRVGADDFGTTLLENLRANGVESNAVLVDHQAGSGMSVAILDRAGDYGAVIVSGSNLNLDPAGCAAAWDRHGGAPVLVLQNEIPEAVNIAAAAAAKRSGGQVVLNAAPARAMSREFLDLVDLLVVNRIEAEMLGGDSVSDAASAMASLPKLGPGGRQVVITLGGHGLVFAGHDGKPQAIAPVKVTVKSTHGAGDCFVGTLAAQLARNADLAVACAEANRAAARHVSGRPVA